MTVELTDDQLALRVRWIKALRSGDYAQGQRVLKQVTPDGKVTYCCLGVLTELVDPTNEKLKLTRVDDDNPYKSVKDADWGVSAARETQEIDDAIGFCMSDGDTCVVWNDGRDGVIDTDPWSFDQIARAVAYATSTGKHLSELAGPRPEVTQPRPWNIPEDFDVDAWLAEEGS